MGERRIGDRRAPEKGVIKIPFKDTIIYLTLSIIIIVSISANIVLASLYNKAKSDYESYINEDDYEEVQADEIDNETEDTEETEETESTEETKETTE